MPNKEPKITHEAVGSSQSYFFAVEVDGSVASRLILTVVHNDNGDYLEHPFAVIEHVKTFEPYRRKGYAKKLILDAIEFAKKHNCYKIEITTSSSHDYVHEMYKSLGFDGEHKTCYWMPLQRPYEIERGDDDDR